jgi:hypothetical protein
VLLGPGHAYRGSYLTHFSDLDMALMIVDLILKFAMLAMGIAFLFHWDQSKNGDYLVIAQIWFVGAIIK